MTHVFDHYGPVAKSELGARNNGVLVSMISGKTLAYALFSLQERGRLFIEPNVDVYEGQIMGLHSRGNDLVVNPTKGKQLTNVRASGSDEAVILTPPCYIVLSRHWSSSMRMNWSKSLPTAFACARNCCWSTSASAHRARQPELAASPGDQPDIQQVRCLSI